MKTHHIIVFLVLVFSTVGGLFAQNTDTMYVVKRHVVRDTVYVRDTLRVQDTIIVADYIHSDEFKQLFYELNGADAQTPPDSLEKLWAQTVTFLENRVLHHEQQNISTMDSIKKYGLAGLMLLGLNSLAPAQTDTTKPVGETHQIEIKSVLRDSPFNGFHFGYTLEANLVHPDHLQFFEDGELTSDTYDKLRYGFRAGLECSYHFADFFGVSAALNYGITSRSADNAWRYRGLSMPLKFEFHYPITDKIWLTANLGTQIRMPLGTIWDEYNPNTGRHPLVNPMAWDFDSNSVYDRNVFYADIMADFGLYYRLPNQDYLRFMVGLNVATTDFARSEHIIDDLYYKSDGEKSGEQAISITERNHYLYFQLAYLHSFSKHRAIKQAQPHWSFDKSLYRHEFRLGVSDPLGFTYLRELFGSPTILGEPIDGISPTKQIFTPVFSLDYHYRVS